jgi:hypothetical protein
MIPANLTSECPALTPVKVGDSIDDKLIDVTFLYHDCRAKHKALVEVTK